MKFLKKLILFQLIIVLIHSKFGFKKHKLFLLNFINEENGKLGFISSKLSQNEFLY